MKNVIILFYLQMLVVSSTSAQPRYQFSTTSNSYQNLDNPVILNDATYSELHDDFMVESDFEILYFGQKTYSILVKNIGTVHMTNGGARIELLPVRLKIKSDSQISYQKVGDSNCGNRILKIEFKNMGFQCDTTDSYFINAQLWIYENSNIFEFHYGASLDNPDIYFVDNWMGTVDCYGRNYYGGRMRLAYGWSAQVYDDPVAPKFYQGDLANFNLRGIESIPPEGMVYLFDPQIFPDGNFTMNPNPARYYIDVSRPLACGDFELRIFDVRGQLIHKREFIENGDRIKTTGLLPGIYFVQIFDRENLETFVKKLLIL